MCCPQMSNKGVDVSDNFDVTSETLHQREKEMTHDIIVFIAGTAWLIPLLRAAFSSHETTEENNS